MYGYKPTAARSWKHPEPEPPARVAINTNDGNFAFLYTRESDRIGSEVAKPTNSIQHEEKSKAMLLREKRDKLRETQSRMPPPLTEHEVTSMKAAETTRALNSFKHEPTSQDPRYTTETNAFGFKPPTRATFVSERAFRTQAFSNSFNNVKPMQTGLNTSLTKSAVHPKLDPQFV
jgi:hypothetical protein